ncbi:unnamed protein product [Rotaria sordida]|uniref:F-box domain-containing protein n=1 Tax=Rotaria sordida TaxID=392033 RepID=A0A819A5R7_9BILA|nr:unnamed protein product [Rotaria sordida]
MMQFESLANELLLDLFEFFDTYYLLHAFFGLNHRFNQLVYIHFRIHQLNFQSISKEHFDLVCQKYLPLIIDKITSIRLSNEETPNLPELLLTRGFTLDRFIHLQSLSLYKIHSLDTLIQITSQLQHLHYLTHFMMIYCSVSWWRDDAGFVLFKNICNIPNLTHCNLSSIQTISIRFSEILIVSSSIENLSMENITCNLHALSNLFKCTPHLQRLCTTVDLSSMDEQLEFVIPSIISLKLSFRGSFESMNNVFQKMPNLCYLTIDTSGIYLNGYTWEQIIIHYLPKLKIFQLKMDFEFTDYNNIQEQIDELLNSFRSEFWLVEHQWFVECYWNPSDFNRCITLYTLPYVFNTFNYSDEYHFKSTCIHKEIYCKYKSVQFFSYNNLENSWFNNFTPFFGCFPNIRHMDIELPLKNELYSYNLKLNQLISLNVKLRNSYDYYQLQTILDYAPRLYLLKVNAVHRFYTGLFQLRSKSIRRLDLIDTQVKNWYHLTIDDSAKLISSPLVLQCEVISVRMKNRRSVLNLIQNVSNIRSLIFQCEDDQQLYVETHNLELDPVYWLQNRLPSTYSITRNLEKSSIIQVWIDQKIKRQRMTIS